MRSSKHSSLRAFILCGAVSLMLCPAPGFAAKKIQFSDPDSPIVERETQSAAQKEIARTSGKSFRMDNNPDLSMPAMMPPATTQRPPREKKQKDEFLSIDKQQDNDTTDLTESLLSSHLQKSTLTKGWDRNESKMSDENRNDRFQDSDRGRRSTDDNRRFGADMRSYSSNDRDRRGSDDRRLVGALDSFYDRNMRDMEPDKVDERSATKAKELEALSRMTSPNSPVTQSDPLSLSQGDIWKPLEGDRPSFGSRSGEFDSRRTASGYEAPITGPTRWENPASPAARMDQRQNSTRSKFNDDQSNSRNQTPVFLPFPQRPGSLLK